jgi:rhodanese-related sulfurtransferase/DNA-binding transcriptional ArsR family regulator
VSERRAAKDDLFDAFASVAAALGNGRRAEIIDVLAQGERSVDDVAREITQSRANTSHHLRLLAGAGLVRSRRDGARVVYRLTSDRVAELWAAVRELGEQHVAEVAVLAGEYLGSRDEVEQVTAAELAARLARGDAVVVDVRPDAEYRAGHIAGAISVPLARLDANIDALTGDDEVIAYCRGPYCVYADDAVRLLRARGVTAKRLDIGFPEWRRARLPIEPAEVNVP